MATPRELDAFLANVERRAYKTAWFAVHNEENALDIVQDAMLKLAESYGDRPAEELPALFQRILQNTIRDFYRRSKVRSLWTTLFSALGWFAGRAGRSSRLHVLAGTESGRTTGERR